MSAPWSRLVRFALIGTALIVALALWDVGTKGATLGIVQPGADGPSAEVFARDFPDVALPGGSGHDGQQFYAIARAPFDLDALSEHLDRPRYRLQRPVFPAVAWLLHPTGGGDGLVVAFIVVGIVSIFLLGLAAGLLSTTLGGGTWPAMLAPLLPGTYAAFRLTLADTLALALALFALVAAERNRTLKACVTAVLAVLAKESMLVVVVAHAAFRRTRAAAVASTAALVSAAGWWLVVRMSVDSETKQIVEFTRPFGGVVESADRWFAGEDWVAAVTVIISFGLAAFALWRRGIRHPLFGALAAATAFSTVLGPDVLGLDYNGTRTIAPVLLLSILTLGTPTDAGQEKTDGCAVGAMIQ